MKFAYIILSMKHYEEIYLKINGVKISFSDVAELLVQQNNYYN